MHGRAQSYILRIALVTTRIYVDVHVFEVEMEWWTKQVSEIQSGTSHLTL